MKEPQFDQLFGRYRDAIGTCSKVPQLRRVRSRRPYAVAATAITAFVALAFLAWPHDATSKTLRRVGSAIKDVRSMVVSFEIQHRSGKWNEWLRIYYDSGKWRHEHRRYSEVSIINDGQVLTERPWLDYALLEPDSPYFHSWSTAEEICPIDFAKYAAGYYDAGEPLDIFESDWSDREYKLTIQKKGWAHATVIRLDRKTNLPIEALTELDQGRDGIARRRQIYRFNEPLDPALFELQSQKPMVVLLEEQRELQLAWRKPIATVGRTKVRDLCMTNDGAVWMAVSGDELQLALPITLLAGPGIEYGRTEGVMIPSGAKAGKKRATVEGESIWIVVFVPMDDRKKLQGKATFQFQQVPPGGISRWKIDEGSKVLPVELLPRREPGERPSYLRALDLDYGSPYSKETGLWSARSRIYELRLDFAKAAVALEMSLRRSKWPRWAGGGAYERLATLYRRAGMMEQSKRATAKAVELRKFQWPDE